MFVWPYLPIPDRPSFAEYVLQEVIVHALEVAQVVRSRSVTRIIRIPDERTDLQEALRRVLDHPRHELHGDDAIARRSQILVTEIGLFVLVEDGL